MRSLRVVGLEEDGETVVCEDPDNGERFAVPADERLRAAARGDLTRLGQAQIEMEAQMRPKEIQARIRAGASVAQVSEASGLPEQRVERYAHPVLLERAQVAERAQRAHPIREDGPDVQTLGEVIAHTFGMRGHDYNETSWDSWRGEDNKWVVSLSWQAGRSENTAHWTFHPGVNGGTIAPLDEQAMDLLDPSPNRPLRTVRPVTELARNALRLDHAELDEPVEQSGEPAQPAPLLGDGAEPTPSSADEQGEGTGRTSPQVPPVASHPNPDAANTTASPPTEDTAEPAAESAAAERADQPTEHEPHDAERRNGRSAHPIVPSWEDVLLGVRSHR